MLDKGVERRGPPKPAGFFGKISIGLARLIVPVVSLLFVSLLLWRLKSEVATDFRFLTSFDASLNPSSGHWLTWGLVVLPFFWFAINLINRRYGSGFTFLAVVLAWAFLAGGVYWALRQSLITSFADDIAPVQQAVAFGAALFLGQMICIYLFEWLRGIPWWEAPFVAALVAGIAQTFAFQALHAGASTDALTHAFIGPDVWPRLLALTVLQFVWAIGQLLPTAMLRRIIRPLSGYGGA
ncbi:MAG: hypothetical protein ACOH12_13885 [Parvibaculaceae bacterium]